MMSIDEIVAHLEIQQVLARYCRGVDRGDKELIKSIYHPDAIDSHGAWKGPGTKFADFIVKQMDRASGIGQHHITNVLIELDGDRARVESYFLALQPELGSEGGLSPSAGRYLDRFELRDGAWKIAHRQVIIDWMGPTLSDAQTEFQKQFPNGKRREEDLSYSLFK